ncbi:MAG TPA: class I SAM-dependent methyltransferase [Myxococcota bacterium]|nr:class I SAM-dependent methyltransferase [Myxococcota bacterium]
MADAVKPEAEFPPGFFRRIDESSDQDFYREPRLVTHLDDATLEALTAAYRELVPAGARVLDLMSSWVSHLPPEVEYAQVCGLGMNEEELERNSRLHAYVVHDLNTNPTLPFPDGSFDAVLNSVSVQYLTQPVEVFAEVRRVLRPEGLHVVAYSHRLFPTKAIAGWQALHMDERARLVAAYFALSRGWTRPGQLDRSPPGADPLHLVFAARAAGPAGAAG